MDGKNQETIIKPLYQIHCGLVPSGILFRGSLKPVPQILNIFLEDSPVPPPEVRSLTGDSAYTFKGLLLGEKGSRRQGWEQRQYLPDPGTQVGLTCGDFAPDWARAMNYSISAVWEGRGEHSVTDLLLLLSFLRGIVQVSKTQNIKLPLSAWQTKHTLMNRTSILQAVIH